MNLFARLGPLAYRYRWPTLAFWAVVLVMAAFFAPKLGGQLKGGGFEGSGRDSELAKDLMVEEFGLPRATLVIVFESDNLSAKSEEYRRAEDEALEPLRNMEDIRSVTAYADTGDQRFLSEDGSKTYALVGFDVSVAETQSLVDEVRRKVRSDELTTYVTGPSAVYLDITNASAEDIRRAEKYAFPLALVVLVIAFGTLVAAGIPVLIGGVSVVTALAALYFLAGVYDMSVYVLSIATMLGLGLGIDYALLAVSRFREELENYPIAEAVERTVATAGRSIFFSGLAVLIGLSGLLFFPFMFIRSIGVAGVVVVFVSVCAALTLLPAVLGVLGHKVNALAVRRNRGPVGAGFWGRSAEAVMRHPVLVILIVGAILSALLYPVTHMKIGIPEASVLPDEYESRAGDDILKQDFDYAALSPMQIVANVPEGPLSADGLEDIRRLGESVRETDGVKSVESIYTIGETAARDYAERVAEARKEAEAEARGRTETLVEERYNQLVQEQIQVEVEERTSQLVAEEGPSPPGAEEEIRSQVESEVRSSSGGVRSQRTDTVRGRGGPSTASRGAGSEPTRRHLGRWRDHCRRRRQLPETTRSPPVRGAAGRKRRTRGGILHTAAGRHGGQPLRRGRPRDRRRSALGRATGGGKIFRRRPLCRTERLHLQRLRQGALRGGVRSWGNLPGTALHLPLRLYPVEGGRGKHSEPHGELRRAGLRVPGWQLLERAELCAAGLRGRHPPDPDLLYDLRGLDGLRGVSPLPHQGGLRERRLQHRQRRKGAGVYRRYHYVGRRHHHHRDRRVRL